MKQIEFVKQKLLDDGYITRNEALQNYISRLSAIIYSLKQDGWNIVGERKEYKKKNGEKGYDYVYTLVQTAKAS